MKRFKDKYRIETARLPGHDYASPGWYFVTICTKDRSCFFGEVHGGFMGLTDVGCTAHQYWAAIPDHSDRARLDAFVVMPNHVHGIVGIVSAGDPVETLHGAEGYASGATSLQQQPVKANKTMSDLSPASDSLSTIIRSYKSAVTRRAHRNDHDDFAWQSRFWDRVIRNDRELQTTRRYIHENILKWHLDTNHPDNL